jgi:hypothetical protein
MELGYCALLFVSVGVVVLSSILFKRSLKALSESKWEPQPGFPEVSISSPRTPGVLYLYIASLRPWGNPNPSPYSLKLETWLRMKSIKFTIIRNFELSKTPKGKIAWIELDDLKMGDSELIIKHLSNLYNVSDNLSDYESAIAHSYIHLTSD